MHACMYRLGGKERGVADIHVDTMTLSVCIEVKQCETD
jgi:hypothetical protein